MNEQELREENERLRRELAKMTASRERLMTWLCQALNFKPMSEEEIDEMMKRPGQDISDLLRDLLSA